MVSVLFVDDDLAGLRALREAHSVNEGWDALFVPGAGAALELMSDQPMDAVIASARLSGTSATKFLRMAKDRFPATARIALSNPGDRNAMLSTLPVVNQCLNRSCATEILLKVVERTSRLQKKLYSEATRALADTIGTLPSMPAALTALDSALCREDCSLGQIADIMGSDVAMSAKVLQLVNSSFFGLRTEVTNLRQAVAYLGIETLRDFTMAGALFRAFVPGPSLPDGWLASFNAHALAVADITGRLVRTSLAQCEANVAGMLHGIGELVVAERAPDKLMEIAGEVASGESPDDAEERHLGTTFPVIGGYMLSSWGMGHHIVEAVTCQRELWEGPARDPELVDVLRVSDHLAARSPGMPDDPARGPEDAAAGDVWLRARSPGADAWVCLASRLIDAGEAYQERVGLIGAVRMQGQWLTKPA